MKPSQSILLRNCVRIDSEGLEYRFMMKLPATKGRRVEGQNAAQMLEKHAAEALNNLKYSTISKTVIDSHVYCYLDQLELRRLLKEQGTDDSSLIIILMILRT